MISKVEAQIITARQIQKATVLPIYKWVESLVCQIMLTVFQVSIKDNQMLNNESIACLNKAAKLTLAHQVLNNRQQLWVCLKNLIINIIWGAIIAIIGLANKLTTSKFNRRKFMYQEIWVQICHHNLIQLVVDLVWEVLTTGEILMARSARAIATVFLPMDK